ncbi:hypothetical protein VN12_18325 [Pirellula sp. SH-Sr6A]|nr:hypothetical protein VN12_18325 [Pirellula sp. SH-Sr6A]
MIVPVPSLERLGYCLPSLPGLTPPKTPMLHLIRWVPRIPTTYRSRSFGTRSVMVNRGGHGGTRSWPRVVGDNAYIPKRWHSPKVGAYYSGSYFLSSLPGLTR